MKKINKIILSTIFLSLIIIGLNIPKPCKAQTHKVEIKIVGAPNSILAGKTFTVDVVINPLVPNLMMDKLQIYVLCDTNYMTIIKSNSHVDGKFPNIDVDAVVGGGVGYLLRAWGTVVLVEKRSWVTLTIRCSGSGSSAIKLHDIATWLYYGPEPLDTELINARVSQRERALIVGGFYYSIDKLDVLMPYLIAMSLICFTTISSFIFKKLRS